MIIEPTVKASFPTETLENNGKTEKLIAEKKRYLEENNGLKKENEKLVKEIEALKAANAELKAQDKKGKKGGE